MLPELIIILIIINYYIIIIIIFIIIQTSAEAGKAEALFFTKAPEARFCRHSAPRKDITAKCDSLHDTAKVSQASALYREVAV